jgi:lathosterol oxidase
MIYKEMFNILLSILSYDLWFYISHVLLHTPYLYKYHKLHHSKTEPEFLDTYLGDSFESIFQGVGTFIPFIVYKYSIVDIIIILSFLNIRGMLRHDKRGMWIVGNHHLLHHKYPQYNYGEYWIDYLCGTLK